MLRSFTPTVLRSSSLFLPALRMSTSARCGWPTSRCCGSGLVLQYTADCSLSKHSNCGSHTMQGTLLGEKLRPNLYWYKNISHFSIQGIQLLSKSSKWKTAHQVLCVGQVTGSGSLWLRVRNYVSRVEPQRKTTRTRYHLFFRNHSLSA